jgi:predicted acetyltransferase
VEIRPLRADDDLDAQLDLAERAFGTKSAGERDWWRQLTTLVAANGTAFGAFEGQRPAGAAMFIDMRQWWHGRAVPMAGVSGVKVAPEERGRGIGRRMMTRVLDEIAARGYPLSVLYPATMPIYRSLGWELAGARYTVKVPSRSLRALMAADVSAEAPEAPEAPAAPRNLRRAGPADAAAVVDVIGRAHEAARDCGPLTWSPEAMAIYLRDPACYSYLCDDGFTSYRWESGNDGLFVGGVLAASAGTLRGLWSIIASHGSIAESVRAWTSPADPLWWLTSERDVDVQSRRMWMLRVVDAPAAIAARGFPAAVAATVPLIIADRSRPVNAGHWTLSVAGGKGELAPATAGHPATSLTLGARGLAALYGGAPVTSLRQAGLAAGGDPDTDAALDAAFAARPFLLDAF